MPASPGNMDGSPPTCGQCGYDLRGSLESAGCPECGWSVVASLRGWHIKDSRVWIRPKGARLPKFCVATGEAVDDPPKIRKGEHIHAILLFPLTLGCMGGCVFPPLALLWILYFKYRQSYEVAYYVSEARWRRRHLLRYGFAALLVAGFGALWATTIYPPSHWASQPPFPQILFVCGFVFIIVGIILAIYAEYASPIPSVDSNDGHHLRLTRLSDAFLAQAAKIPGAVAMDVAKPPG